MFLTSGSTARVWWPHSEHSVWTYNRVWGQNPQQGPVADPLVRGSGQKPLWSWTLFCICTTWGVGQFVLKYVSGRTNNFVGRLGPPGSASDVAMVVCPAARQQITCQTSHHRQRTSASHVKQQCIAITRRWTRSNYRISNHLRIYAVTSTANEQRQQHTTAH